MAVEDLLPGGESVFEAVLDGALARDRVGHDATGSTAPPTTSPSRRRAPLVAPLAPNHQLHPPGTATGRFSFPFSFVRLFVSFLFFWHSFSFFFFFFFGFGCCRFSSVVVCSASRNQEKKETKKRSHQKRPTPKLEPIRHCILKTR